MEDVPTLDYVSKHVAKVQQEYTQRGGVRPFGVSCFIIGFDAGSDKPQLYLTEPSGHCSLWKAHAIGRNSKNLKTFLEKHYEDDLTEDKTVRLAIETLQESVESEKHIEIAIQRQGQEPEMLSSEAIESIVEDIKKEREDN